MKKIIAVLFVAALAVPLFGVSSADARSTYLNAFNLLYSANGTKLDDCITCHGATKSIRNPYGQAVEAELATGAGIENALANIEILDSDGDNYINVEEILFGTFPGDASDYPTSTTCTDNDGDGFFVEPYCSVVDCDDNNPQVYPGAAEVCDDNIDNDCNGQVDCQDGSCASDPVCVTCTDADGDGYAIEGGGCGPIDCNDSDLAVHPGAIENCGDLIDNDCDDLIDCVDGDCTGDVSCAGACIPEASQEKGKKCSDGLDNDCDGVIDAADPDCGGDTGGTGGAEGKGKTCSDGIDNDGDGLVDCADPDCAAARTCK